MALGDPILHEIGLCAIATISLTILLLITRRLKTFRIFVLCGSTLLIGLGIILFVLFYSLIRIGNGWLPCILYGIIPVVVGSIGLFRLSQSSRRNDGK
jgi:hypothetical protein